MVKAEHVPELVALLREHEKLSCFLNSGHYVINIDARFGDYSRPHKENLEIWLTGDDDESAELGLSFVFDLVRSRVQGIRKKLETLGVPIEGSDS